MPAAVRASSCPQQFLATGDNGPGVAHAPSWRGGLAGDESDYRFLDVRFDVGGGRFFGCASDFANQDDGFGPRSSLSSLSASTWWCR